jgi:hypothetical protein
MLSFIIKVLVSLILGTGASLYLFKPNDLHKLTLTSHVNTKDYIFFKICEVTHIASGRKQKYMGILQKWIILQNWAILK